jgi:hypothetical protein
MKPVLVFSITLIVIAGSITGINYILSPPQDSIPVVILFEDIRMFDSATQFFEGSFSVRIDVPLNQILLNLTLHETASVLFSLNNDSLYTFYSLGNVTGLNAGSYTSGWISVDPGNYTLVYAFSGDLICQIVILGRNYQDWM